MLILTVRAIPGKDTIYVGDNVKITLIGVKGNQTRLGIEAPKSIPVHREEIYERIKRIVEGDADGNVDNKPAT